MADQAEGIAAPLLDERPDTMLDVHPPHGGIFSWKDFFIHIATITIGLLIALGLEQTVEYVHHRTQLAEARSELAAEADENRQGLAQNRKELARITAQLAANMAMLRLAAPADGPPPAGLNYAWAFRRPREGAWDVARQNGSLDLMPHAEMQAYAHLYAVLESSMEALTAHGIVMDRAAAIAARVPPSAMTPKDVDELMTVTSEAQGRSVFLAHNFAFEALALGVTVPDASETAKVILPISARTP